jgi:hypothetical protein
MRKLVFAVLVSWAFMILAVPGFAGPPASYDSVVAGKADPAYDVRAVQDAVDRGGKVLLKGTFDFGEKGRVNINNDVQIFGEAHKKGAPLTKIKGGFWSFHSPLPAQLPPQAQGPKITIQGIHFDGALYSPIHLAYSSGATIKANKITNVHPMQTDEVIFGKSGLYRQKAIVCGSHYAQPKQTRKYRPGAFTGLLTVADNDIDLHNEVPTKSLAQGVLIQWTTGATIKIFHNRIHNCARNSIETLDNFRGEDGSGMTIIKDNHVVTAIKGVPVPTPSTPNGIIAGWFYDITGAADPKRNTKVLIMGNHIEARGDTSMAVSVLCDGAVVMSNNILLGGGKKARGVLQLGSDGLIANNKVEGSGLCAALTMPYKGLKACGNTFVGNDLSRFKASMADVLLQSSDNIVIGKCGKVAGKGQRNLVLD